MRRLVVDALRKDGHEVLQVEDGRGLFDILAGVLNADLSGPTIDLVVSDDRMPVRSGLDVLEQLGNSKRRPAIIVMTAFANDRTRSRAEKLGGLLLEKPLSLSSLKAAVDALLDRTAKTREFNIPPSRE
jgi:DNA-binding response OmpR family regulator